MHDASCEGDGMRYQTLDEVQGHLTAITTIYAPGIHGVEGQQSTMTHTLWCPDNLNWFMFVLMLEFVEIFST